MPEPGSRSKQCGTFMLPENKAAIQYLRTIVVTTDETVLAAAGGRVRATAEEPEAMSPGRLAFKWPPEDQASPPADLPTEPRRVYGTRLQ